MIDGPLSQGDLYQIGSGSDDDVPDDPTVTVALVVKIVIFGVLVGAMVWVALGVIRFFMVASYG
jgi:hypothetical protein